MSSDARQSLVLIVEDDAFLRVGMSALVRSARHTTLAAATVGEAHAHLDAQTPTHALLDLNLPDGLGTVVLQRIREENRPVRVAMLTGTADEDSLTDARALDVDAVFLKPPDWDKVLRWLAQP